jgi:hypothetical protein
MLADEQRAKAIGLLAPAVGWFSEQGINCRRVLSGNGSSDRTGDWRQAWGAFGLKPIRTKASSPQTNGKTERLIKTLLEEWACVIACQTTEEWNLWLPRYLGITNGSSAPWLSVASPPSGGSSDCWGVNGLVGNHT